MNIFSVAGGKVSVVRAHHHCSSRTAVDDTDMNRAGCGPKT